MSWNYRVFRRTDRGEEEFAVHEAFYEDGMDEPTSWTKTPVTAEAESLDQLRRDLQGMLLALDKPIIDYGGS